MSLLSNPEYLIVFFIGYISAFAAAYFVLVEPKRKRRIERKNKFFKALVEGLKINSLETIDDCHLYF